MEPRIGIKPADRKKSADILNRLVADEYVLLVKLKNYHWNLEGPHFNHLHKFLDEQYEEVEEIVDLAAERVRMLGVRSVGTLAEFQKLSRLKEQPGKVPSIPQMLKNLLADNESLVRQLCDDQEKVMKWDDVGTNDFLVGTLRKHEKMSWMLRASL